MFSEILWGSGKGIEYRRRQLPKSAGSVRSQTSGGQIDKKNGHLKKL
jgi:hypothetical protein